MRDTGQTWASAAKLLLHVAAVIAVSATLGHAAALVSASSCMTSALQKETSLDDFPYDTYLASCGVADFHLLENDRRFLQDQGRDGDRFLFSLFSRHLSRHPPNPASEADVKGLVALADGALSYGPDGAGHAYVYRTIGYLLLDGLNLRTKEAISSKRLIKDSREARYVLQALSERGYKLAFPTTRWEKLRRHICEGNWSYILDRLWLEVVQHRAAVLVAVLAVSAGVMFRRSITRQRSRTEKMT